MQAGLGAARGAEGAALVPSPDLATVRTYASGADLDAAMADDRRVYGRHGHASGMALEEALAGLETAEGGTQPVARVTASGQAALLLLVSLHVRPGRSRVVVVRPGYGSTEAAVDALAGFGVELVVVDLPLPDAAGDHGALVAAALDGRTALVVTEVVTNPLVGVVDVPAIATACRAAGVACAVDATFVTPFLFRAFEHGVDAVWHSLTKVLSGHSDVLGGVALVAAESEAARLIDARWRLLGVGLGPTESWLTLRGLRTAGLRLERACANAAALAEWLPGQPGVAAVHYPGVRGAVDAERASRLLPEGRGSMLGLEVSGGAAAADAVVQRSELIRLAPSLGDVSTTASVPARSSHRELGAEGRAALGISDGLVRLSVGCEDVEDLRADLGRALAAG
ncbi:MAG: aminotransferase class I/II-fold pyridoxal phosphate-dependent enzyme [Candidatus Dormibacteria bacterium]